MGRVTDMGQDKQAQQQGEHSTAGDAAAELAVPRRLGPRGRRRVWLEPSVRFWWSCAILIILGAGGIGIRSVSEWREDNYLIREGASANALVWNDLARIKDRPVDISSEVSIEYEYNGSKYTQQARLYNTGEQYQSGRPIPIHVDPHDPSRWTNRTQAASFGGSMIGAGLALLAGLATAFGAWMSARRVVDLWCNGELRVGRVLEHGHSALAPRSVSLRCAVRCGKTERVASVFVPQSAHPPAPGEVVQLVTNANGSKALAVMNFYP